MAEADDVRLEQFRGVNPVLVVFTPSLLAEPYRAQLEAIATGGEFLSGRGLVLVEVRGDLLGLVQGRPLNLLAVQHLRDRFDVPPEEFRAVLLDADGREMVRSTIPLPAPALARLLGPGPVLEAPQPAP